MMPMTPPPTTTPTKYNHHQHQSEQQPPSLSHASYCMDAVESILSNEEILELSSFPSFPGTYYDRNTQKLCISKSIRSNYEIDINLSLKELIKRCNKKEEKLFEKLERKGHVSSRVIARIKQKNKNEDSQGDDN